MSNKNNIRLTRNKDVAIQLCSGERRNFQSSYKQTDMIFESDVVGTDLHNFDAFDAYNALIDSDTAHVAPVFTNLVMWMSRQDDATITALYQQIMASFRDRIQQEPKILYVTRCHICFNLSAGPPRGVAGGAMTPGPMDFRGPIGFRKAAGFSGPSRGPVSSRGGPSK